MDKTKVGAETFRKVLKQIQLNLNCVSGKKRLTFLILKERVYFS